MCIIICKSVQYTCTHTHTFLLVQPENIHTSWVNLALEALPGAIKGNIAKGIWELLVHSRMPKPCYINVIWNFGTNEIIFSSGLQFELSNDQFVISITHSTLRNTDIAYIIQIIPPSGNKIYLVTVFRSWMDPC